MSNLGGIKEISLEELDQEVRVQAKRLRPLDKIIYAYLDDGLLVVEFQDASDPYRFINRQLVRWRSQ